MRGARDAAGALLCGPEFFSRHTVGELRGWTDRALAQAGRLSHPLRYDPALDVYRPVSWEEAVELVATGLKRVGDPDRVEFFSSGKTSNEAAFLYQLFARRFGTNNLPVCLNRTTSLALRQSVGCEASTCRLEDFDLADAVFIFGQNPQTTPRPLAEKLRAASGRGAAIVYFDPLLDPKDAPRGGTGDESTGSPAASRHGETFQLRVGGDAAAVTGVLKALFEAEATAQAAGRPPVVDRDFIERHTLGVDALANSVRSQDWSDIERRSGLGRDQMKRAAAIYAGAERVICLYGMGVTQHRGGVDNVRQIANLALIRGNVGKPGAGLCPVSGHSYVTNVGLVPDPPIELLGKIEARYGFRPPRTRGHDLVHALKAMVSGEARICVALGGNIAAASPDRERVAAALAAMDLTVHVSTRLNRSHFAHGRNAVILPCLERGEADRRAGKLQASTVEDFLSDVRLIVGKEKPAAPLLKSETEIIAALASAACGAGPGPDWIRLSENHAAIRDEIEALFPAFENYNAKLDAFGMLRLAPPAARRRWATPSAKAMFAAPAQTSRETGELLLTTLRGAGQYNTSPEPEPEIRASYRRDVIFLNGEEMSARRLVAGDLVQVVAISPDGADRRVTGLTVVERSMASGCCAAYFPETNALVPLEACDPESFTPSFKAVPVRIRKVRPAGRSPLEIERWAMPSPG